MRPDSRTPRRLPTISRATNPSADLDAVGRPLRKGRRQRRHAGRDAHRHRQHVVDEQRRGGHQARRRARGSPWRRCRRRRRSGRRESSAGTRRRRSPASTAMTTPIGVTRLMRGDAADQQDAQDLLGGVGDRRQRVGRQHRQPGDAGQPFVVGVVRRNARADEHALELREERLVGHGHLQPPTGLADGLEVGVLYRPLRLKPRRADSPRWAACPRGSPVSLRPERTWRYTDYAEPIGRLGGVLMNFLRLSYGVGRHWMHASRMPQ